MSNGSIVFMAMVFVAVFLLSQGIVVPAFGDSGKARKRLRQRLLEVEAASGEESTRRFCGPSTFASCHRQNAGWNLCPVWKHWLV
jgi:hypothetical protein